MPSTATSGAVPLLMAWRTAVSVLLGTDLTVIQGYFCWNAVMALLNSPSSGLEKKLQSVSVTGACEADGLIVGGGLELLFPPAVQAAANSPIEASAEMNT